MSRHPRVDENLLHELESMDSSVEAVKKILLMTEEGVRIARMITEMAQNFPEARNLDVGFGGENRAVLGEILGRATAIPGSKHGRTLHRS